MKLSNSPMAKLSSSAAPAVSRVTLVHNLAFLAKTGLIALLLACFAPTAVAQLRSIPVVDSTFSPYAGTKLPIAFQADGKILVSGVSFLSNGVTQQGIARLNSDGTLDSTFTPGAAVNVSTVSFIVVQPDGKILVGGVAPGVIRLNKDGTLDAGFTYDGPANVTKVALSTSGDIFILANGGSQVRRHSAAGITKTLLQRPIQIIPAPVSGDPTLINRFPDGDVVAVDVAELSSGTVVSSFYVKDNGGTSSQPSTKPTDIRIFAYDATGALLANWPAASVVQWDIPALSANWKGTTQIIPVSTGGYYILGSSYDAVPSLALYKADGTLDPSFQAPPMQFAYTFRQPGNYLNGALDSAGRLVLGGAYFPNSGLGIDLPFAVRLLANGSVDPLFGVSIGHYAPDYILGFGGVQKGTTADKDRIFVYRYDLGSMVAYSPTNSLILGSASSLPSTQTVTAGKGISLSAVQAGTNIQWQVSTNGGSTWSNLTSDATYQGTTTASLAISNATAAMNGYQYRYVSTAPGGTATSNSSTLTVAPLFFPNPASIGIDSAKNIYVGDTAIHTIQKISPAFQVSNVAGLSGQTGTSDGTGGSALFNQPAGLAASATGILGVSDTANGTIRSITVAGAVTTLAGSSTTRGSADGVGTAARFSAPIGIALTATGFVVADSTNHTIRSVASDGTVTTIAGTAGMSGASDGTGAAARFNNPTGVAVDANGNIYVSDTTNNLIRKIGAGNVVTTIAGVSGVAGYQDGVGAGALFNHPGGLAVDGPSAGTGTGNIYVADTGNSTIRQITPDGTVTTLAGLPTIGGMKDGTGNDAWFNQPKSLTVDVLGAVIYVADTGNAAIRSVTHRGVVTTLPLSGVGPTITTQPSSVTVTVGNNASFTVAASPNPVTYQWQKGGTAILGATSATFSISSASSTDAGSYTAVVSNSYGSTTSSAATLTVNAAPTPTPTPTPSGGGGGGGAPSVWFLGAFSLLAFARRAFQTRK